MAITAVGEWYQGRQTRENVDLDGRGVRTHTRIYRCTSGAESDTGMDVLNHASVPQLFAAHPDDILATVRERSASQDSKTWKQWVATITYSTETPEPGEDDDNPLDEPVQRSFSGVKVPRIVYQDRDGTSIRNNADQPYDPPIEIERSLGVFRFTRNEKSFTLATVNTYVDKVNSAAIGALAAGTVKCDSINATEQVSKGEFFFVVNYEFAFDAAGWQPEIAELGWKAKKSGSDELERIKDDNGQEISAPWPLNDDGTRRSKADATANGIGTTVWNVYAEVDLLKLGLPWR